MFDPTTISTITSIASFIIAGIFAVLNIVDKSKREKEKELDEIDTKVISLLKEQVTQLEKRVKDQDEKLKFATTLEIRIKEQDILIKETADKLQALIAENNILREILQGRDQDTIFFQKTVIEAVERGKQTFEIVSKTNKITERLLRAIEKHLQHLEQDKSVIN